MILDYGTEFHNARLKFILVQEGSMKFKKVEISPPFLDDSQYPRLLIRDGMRLNRHLIVYQLFRRARIYL